MATLAGIAAFTISFGNTASPIVYTAIPEVLSVGSLGIVGEDLDVTNFSSTPGQKEFIAGLAEGNEVSMECNDINSVVHRNIVAAIGTNRYFRAVWTGTSPNRTVKFIAAIKGYEYIPSTTEQNKITFTLKVSSWNI